MTFAVYRPGETDVDEEFDTMAEAQAYIKGNGGPEGWRLNPIVRVLEDA